jgi:hypothetical protein
MRPPGTTVVGNRDLGPCPSRRPARMLAGMAHPFFRRHRSSRYRPAALGQGGAEPVTVGAALAAESEAFLHGRLADQLVATGRRVPGWVMLNRLAHGTRDELAALGVAGNCGWRVHPSLGGPQWLADERALASRLIGIGTSAEALRTLQDEVLIPLELTLIARSRSESLSPQDVIGAASRALDEDRLDR